MSEKKYIVTIARQFGSLGRPIAMRMSEKLGVEFYDRDIVEEAAKKLNLPVSKIDEIEESAKKKVHSNSFRRMMYPLGTQADSFASIFERRTSAPLHNTLVKSLLFSISAISFFLRL